METRKIPEPPPCPPSTVNLVKGQCQGFSSKPSDHFEPVKLHFAINKEDYFEVRREVERGIDNLNFIIHGNTPLLLAVLRQNIDIVQLLLESGADVNKPEKTKLQRQPLHVASKLGNLKLVKLLMKHGANVHSVDMDDVTALNSAAYFGKNDIVKCLCDAGAHIETKDGRGKTPLFNAVENNNFDTVEMLYNQGATLNTHDNNGWTPLIHSVVCGFLDLAKYLLSAGASVNDTDRNGETALHFACARITPRNVSCLSSSNMDFYTRHVNIVTETVRLAVSSTVDEVALADLLVDSGIDVNALSGFGETPIELALSQNKFILAEFLVNAGAILYQQQMIMDEIILSQNLSHLLRVCGVRALQDHCKFSIRKYIGRYRPSIRAAIGTLPLPDRLLGFLQVSPNSQ